MSRTIKTFLIIFFLLALLPASDAFAVDQVVVASGTCGQNARWTFYNDGLLKISGSGQMSDINASMYPQSPWTNYRNQITKVEVYGVSSIGSYAFHNHNNLTSVTISSTVKKIGMHSFNQCTKLSAVTLSSGITSVEGQAFRGCTSLRSIFLPDTITTIGEFAFADCSNLTSISLPNQLTSIGGYAFNSCSKITSLSLPNGLKSIGNYAFFGCSVLSNITLPIGVTSIGNSTFENCINLTTVSLSDNTLTIGEKAFKGCIKLETIFFPDSIEVIGESAFEKCRALRNVTLPISLIKIESYLFQDCSNLSSVTICDGVSEIGYSAFSKCDNLTSIIIPSSITRIYGVAFNECTALTSIVFCGARPSIANDTFFFFNAKAYYPCHETWNSIAFKDYGGSLNWIPANTYTVEEEYFHRWGTAEYVWSEDYTQVVARVACLQNSLHERTETVDVILSSIVSPTDEVDGEAIYTTLPFVEECFEPQSRTELIPALNKMSVFYLPKDIKIIETQSFAHTACEAVIIPEGCTTIKSHASRLDKKRSRSLMFLEAIIFLLSISAET